MEGEQVGTELVGKETVGVSEMIDDGDTTDVDGELNVAGLVGNEGAELIGMETTDGEDTDNVDGGKKNGGE